jgi:hypothetical protein
MTDKLHSHLTIGTVDGCPACTQLAFDFAAIRDSARAGTPTIGAIREAGRIARGEPAPVVTYAVTTGQADAHTRAALEQRQLAARI